MKYYIVYQITNKINQKIYIGCHETENLDDGYLGSGKLISQAIEKYGQEAFEREILFKFDNSEEMFLKEEEIVNKEFVQRKDTYNIKVGGQGGWYHLNYGDQRDKNLRFDSEHQRQISGFSDFWANFDELPDSRKTELQEIKSLAAKKCAETKRKRYGSVNANSWIGKRHRKDTIDKIKKTKKGSGMNSENSQFSTCWIYSDDLRTSKKIKKTEIEFYISEGWKLGRKIKF